MAILEKLTEEECYLLAILTDESGLDQAEFLWHAPEFEDTHGCFRAWPFQHRWWRNSDTRQIDQAARSVGKSLSLQVRACAFPILYPHEEMLLTAPEGNHLEAVTDLIETRILSLRFYRELLRKTPSSNGIKHRSFQINFANGSRILGRIPQRDGRGIKGMHPLWLEMDEAQDYPEAGWTELFETLKTTTNKSRWRSHGVTRGVRDSFWRFTQHESDWTVHEIKAMHRPTWSEEELRAAIEKYGSRNHPDFRRNIEGLHGDVSNPLFVLTKLMQCFDGDPASDYNQSEFTRINISDEYINDMGGDVLGCLDVPMTHTKYDVTWGGMDFGFTNHPSEILIFGEEKVPGMGDTRLKLLTRLHLERVSAPDQREIVMWLVRFYKLRAFSMDKTGNGLPVFQEIQRMAEEDPSINNVLDKIKGYNFSEKILVDFDQEVVEKLDEFNGDLIKDAGIYRRVLEYASDKLREYVDQKRILLPEDDIIKEFQGQTWTTDKSGMDRYGRKVYSKGAFHALDAARMAICGHAQYEMEAFLREYYRKDDDPPTFDVFF